MDFAFLDEVKKIKKHKGVTIGIDIDKKTRYEKNNIFRKIINFFWIPFLNSVPYSFQNFVKKTNKNAGKVIKNRTSHKALEILYQGGIKKKEDGLWTKISRKIWFSVNNSKAVRNRLKLVEKILKEVLEKIKERRSEIRTLSIASGSARAVLEAVSKINFSEKKIFLNFLDKNPQAHKYSKDLATSILKNDFKKFTTQWITDSASNFPAYFKDKKPDIIEMVGLLDYFGNEQVIKILSLIYENLPEKGTLVTSNINHNWEKKFITRVIGWRMIYKTPEEFIGLAIQAGFDPNKIELICEPLKIHYVLVAEK